jgi:LmbE family N-acetylglucosaminyl deacetylase
MEWIYFSPHLDDVSLSCGGLIWEQRQAGIAVSIWTICAGDPPAGPLSTFAESLHERWQTGGQAVRKRRQEDVASCAELGATYRHLPIADCIYRRGPASGEALYASETALFSQPNPGEAGLIDELCSRLSESLPERAMLVCPLGLGGHVDHRLTRMVVEKMIRGESRAGWELLYYADYPYARTETQKLAELQQSLAWKMHLHPITEAGMLAWQRAVAAYASQISTFWQNLDKMVEDLRAYAQAAGGVCLWQCENPISEQAF